MKERNPVPGLDLGRLKDKFPEKDIKWRISHSDVRADKKVWARVLAYVDARAVMDRLDDVVGAHNWKDDYQQLQGGMVCTLSIRIGTEWVSKQNGSPETQIEAFKGGFSKALVRTAATWGIGRYLYDLGDSYADIHTAKTEGSKFAKTKSGAEFHWTPPKLPEWALPPVYINAVQLKNLWAVATGNGWSDEAVHDFLLERLDILSVKRLEARMLDNFILHMKNNPVKVKQ